MKNQKGEGGDERNRRERPGKVKVFNNVPFKIINVALNDNNAPNVLNALNDHNAPNDFNDPNAQKLTDLQIVSHHIMRTTPIRDL